MTGESPPDPPGPVARSLASGLKPCVGVLFVHGAGDHGVGSTLIEFGEPLVAWLDGWLSKGKLAVTSSDDAARAGAGQILVREADTHAPAHAAVTLRSQRDTGIHVWLLAEARWDEAFTPPAFRQVLLWAIGVVPWTVLTQFVGPLLDESRLLRAELPAILRFFWNVVVSILLALIASVVLQAVAFAILLLSIIPLDPVRDVVSKLQRFASSSVGDLYMVLTSPVQRAALTNAIQRDIDWMRSQGCERLALVAHSQGGYVAYQALTDPWYRPVETFITFGSGLIRLTESERARRTGMLVWALIGVVGALIAIRFAPVAILGTFEVSPKHQASALAFAVGCVMAGALVIAIRRYRNARTRVAILPSPTTWVDFVTNEDPVLNGSRDNRLPDSVEKIRVQNRASVVTDHGAYWQNSDQFVAQVAMTLGALDTELDLKGAGPKAPEKADRHLRRSFRRRGQRIVALERVRGPVALATAILLAWRLDQLEPVGRQVATAFTWFPSVVVSWLPDVIESVIPIAFSHLALLGAAVIVGLSLLGYQIGINFWEAWGRADTARQWSGRRPNPLSPRAIAFYAWAIVHVIVIAVVGLVGPIAIIRFIGDVWAVRDAIVQAWARQYTWSLVAAAVVLGAAWIRTKAVPTRKMLELVLGGTVLAVLAELAIAMLSPGATPANVSIPIGLAAEVLGLIVAQAVAPVASRLFLRFAKAAQRRLKPEVRRGPPASLLDRLGVLGLVATVLAAIMALQPAPVALIFGAVAAIAGLALAWLMATNTAGRRIKYLGPSEPTPEGLRMVGWGSAVAALALLAVEVGRLAIYLATNGIPT
jgi:hypothetical protein